MPVAQGHVLGVLTGATRLPRNAQAAAEAISVTVMLEYSNRAGFEQYVRGFEDPVSLNYHVTLTETEFAARFGPTQQSYDSVVAFLRQSGLTVTNGSANRMTVTASGMRSQVGQAFAVSIDDYELGGRKFHSNDTEPSLPAPVAPAVRSVSGLNNFAPPAPALSPTPRLPQSIGTAYGAGLMPPGITGTGQTIALIEFDNYNPQDVVNWLRVAGLPAGLINQVRTVNVNGGTGASNGKGTTEVLLDIDTVLGIAPGANIVVVAAPQSTPHIDMINSAFNAIRGAPGQSQGIISDSWFSCEREVSNSDIDSIESLLQAIAIQGGTLFAASGDNGATCVNGNTAYANRVTVPSAAPHAVSVGGTTLSVNAGNSYQSESWWNSGSGAGGFGYSWHFGRPPYQAPYTAGSLRSVPDISADADLNTGILVCQGGSPAFPNCPLQGGGTSMAAPTWAALWAMTCQAKGTQPCGASPEYLYSLKSDVFHGFSGMAGPNADFAHVGLGSPNLPFLAARVAGTPQIQSLAPGAGPLSGGTTVTVSGQLFIGVSGVKFAGVPALSFTVNSISQITAVAPPFVDWNGSGSQHAVSVSVTTAIGEFSSGLAVLYKYNPAVTGVSPNSGPITGGGTATITGAGFVAPRGTQVLFGAQMSPNVYCSGSTTCLAEIPPSPAPGRVDVTVLAGGGTIVARGAFTYTGATITKISPGVGPETGGTRVYIYGSGLADTMIFRLGSTVMKTACFSNSWCEFYTPAGTGAQYVTVTFNGLTSPNTPDTLFTWAKFPTVTSVAPGIGPASGGTAVTVFGSNFSAVPGSTAITFGSAPATNVQCTATQCKAITPAGTSTADVAVTVSGLPTALAAHFVYVPVITGVSPKTGPRTGGTTVTITGFGFQSSLSLTVMSFGPNAASALCTATQCTAVSPAGATSVDVQATVDGNTSPKTLADQFTYGAGGVGKGWTQWQLPVNYTGDDVMTYDAVRREVVYVTPQSDDSGNSLDDQTWVWDSVSAAWTQKSSALNPSVIYAPMVFDEARGNAVMFGGVWFTGRPTGIGTIPHMSPATWLWNGTNWTTPVPAVHPSARVFATMAYDAARSRVVLFGGCTDTRCTKVLNDTWTWDGANWKLESPLLSPPARNQAAMSYDRALGKVVMFGGRSNGEVVLGGLADMYAWDGATWTQLHPATTPPARYGMGFGYSRIDSALVLYGGTGNSGYLPETWLWNGLDWTQLNVSPTPTTAFFISGIAYDGTLDAAVLMVGGQVWTWGGRP